MEVKKIYAFLVFAAIFACSLASFKTYDGFQVFKVGPVDLDTLADFAQLQHDPRFDFWTRPQLGENNLVMTSASEVQELTDELGHLNLKYSLYIPDVGPLVLKERQEHELLKQTKKRPFKAATFDRFMEFDEIQTYIDEVAAAYPELATIVELDRTYLGRRIRALHLSNGPGKKAVFIDCAIHAREWIAPPVCLKTITELLDNYAINKDLLDLVDWWVVPVVNADGYVYSFSTDRFWRKNRRPNLPSPCLGVDPNRNFDHHWGGENISDPCSLTYPGDAAFSESESSAIGNQLIAQADNIIIYLAIHSYGELIVYPWGYTTELPPNAPELHAAGKEAADAVFVHRQMEYTTGSSGNLLYLQYGAADDFALGITNIPYSYTWELPGGGTGGFNPPASEIIPVVIETWDGIVTMVRRAAANSKWIK